MVASAPTEDDPDLEASRQAVSTACKTLERARCQETEFEASLLFASQLLQNHHQSSSSSSSIDLSTAYPGLQQAWYKLATTTKGEVVTEESVTLGPGQWGKSIQQDALASSVRQAARCAAQIQAMRLTEGPVLKQAVVVAKKKHALLDLFDERYRELSQYHVNLNKRQRVNEYDLLTDLEEPSVDEEVLGKYLDLQPLFNQHGRAMQELMGESYIDFVQSLQKEEWTTGKHEAWKLKERKAFSKFLTDLEQYLRSFMSRSTPLLKLDSTMEPFLEQFDKEWGEKGGISGQWECIPAEAAMVGSAAVENKPLIDLSNYDSVEKLEQDVDGNVIKAELARVGLKCGGTVSDRAKRLWLTKDTPLDQLPAKLFAKKKDERRVDLARKQASVLAILDQVRPVLDATIHRVVRRQTQTLEEQEKELQEELFQPEVSRETKTDEDSDDDDTPIYNPKNVPLDWDGKPIPYWLFKLHGLNHYYPCEICGGESYRGRRNFELHFAEQKHTLGMKSLGIPNTKHFHGVTKIEDAQELWKTLQVKLQQEQFDNSREEEYEDSHGNVLSRKTYEDLARQGLL